MSKYTYTESLVDESINILRRADQELSGTNASVINAVNTILNARGADRLSFDFSDILNLADFARDDISAVTREILNKQSEIKEYENAPWWKKLFSSIGMTLLKYIEGHAQAIEYIFDLTVSLAGFVGGLFNSEFKSSCKEWAEKNVVNDWFTKQFTDENGLFKDVNAYSVFTYDSTAANIIEFGGSLINTIVYQSYTNPIGGIHSLYRTFENIIEDSDTKAIVTSTPIIARKLKEIFEIKEVETPSSLDDKITDDGGKSVVDNDGDISKDNDLNSTPVQNTDKGNVQFKDNEKSNEKNQKDSQEFEQITVKKEVNQVLYGPPVLNSEETPKTEIIKTETPKTETIKTETVCPPGQVLYGVLPEKEEQILRRDEFETIAPKQVLYGPPCTDPSDISSQVLENNSEQSNESIIIPKASTKATSFKKASGSFGDLINGTNSTPVSSKPISSKNPIVEGKKSAPLASGMLAAGAAGLGTKMYMDKRNSVEKKDEKDELDAEKWDGEVDLDNMDYDDGRLKEIDGDYLSPEDELSFIA